MKKLYVHIGMAKTGTSAIQSFLHTNRDELIKQGVLYPLSGQFPDHSHHELAFAFSPDGYRDDPDRDLEEILNSLSKEIEGSDCSTVILSSECFPLIAEDVRFIDFFEEYEVRVVAFLRDPGDYIESWYRQWVKDPAVRFSDDFDTFFERFKGSLGLRAKVNSWEALTGKGGVVVRDFDVVKKEGDICDEFLSIININTNKDFVVINEVNKSLSFVATEVMLTSNKLGEDPKRSALLGVCLGMNDYGNYVGKKFISPEQKSEITKLYSGQYKNLIEGYSSWKI
jgi:hypothetical protein